MTKEEIQSRVDKLNKWYHKIQLPFGIITPGEPYDDQWNHTREQRKALDYSGKRVLDIASFDGMWAFEAESLGASIVIATDCQWHNYPNMLLCRGVLNSNVIPFYNVPPSKLVSRLDVYFSGSRTAWGRPGIQGDNRFDIVQHLGVFYHLLDPLVSLLQCRAVIKDGGKLLFETACAMNSEETTLLFNDIVGTEGRIFKDSTTWWAPTIPCMLQLLKTALFNPLSFTVLASPDAKIGRLCAVCDAIPISSANQKLVSEFQNTYRTPGLEVTEPRLT